MNSKLKILLPVGILALAAVFLVAFNFGEYLKPEPSGGPITSKNDYLSKGEPPPTLTEEIEAVTEQIDANLIAEEIIYAEVDGDASYFAADKQEIDDFGQVYDAGQF